MSGTLYLIPAALGDSPWQATLPTYARETVCRLDRFVVENAKAARAELKRLEHPLPLRAITIEPLAERPDEARLRGLLEPLARGGSLGLMSDAGCPGVADPGAALVRCAHAMGIKVVPLVGPSSILLALMASGLDGQRFTFHGYLPVKDPPLSERIREIEAASKRDDSTQIFIETPYRNERLFRALMDNTAAGTRLTVASDLTLPTESIATKTTALWRQAKPPKIDRRPSVFLLLAG